MYIILGASGQVGSAIVKQLVDDGKTVRAVIHDAGKTNKFDKEKVEVVVADGYDLSSLTKAFKDGDTVFLLTPETGKSKDLMAETAELLNNYKKVIAGSSIKKIVGLSSMGAELGKDSGNLEMSYMLEHAFHELVVEQVFIRPAYYFSNWLMGVDQIKSSGVLKTFYPADLAIPMISPQDVAKFSAGILTDEKRTNAEQIYELTGPQAYTSNDVADAFAEALDKTVKAEQIPREKWPEVVKQMGFSEDGANNFIKMTDIVVAGKTNGGGKDVNQLKGNTTLKEFINKAIIVK